MLTNLSGLMDPEASFSFKAWFFERLNSKDLILLLNSLIWPPPGLSSDVDLGNTLYTSASMAVAIATFPSASVRLFLAFFLVVSSSSFSCSTVFLFSVL